jgi:hypothetical protein
MAAKIGTVRDYGAAPWSTLATRIPKSLHRAVRLHCVENDTLMKVFVVDALREKLAREAGARRGKRTPSK